MRVHVRRDRKECVGKSLRYDLMGIGKLAYPQDTLFRSRGIVTGIDLGRGHVELAQPDGRVPGSNAMRRLYSEREKDKGCQPRLTDED